MAAMERRDYKAAQALFAREVKRAPYHDEFHFWFGIASLGLGETGRARSDRTGGGKQRRARRRTLYSAKLEHLRALLPR